MSSLNGGGWVWAQRPEEFYTGFCTVFETYPEALADAKTRPWLKRAWIGPVDRLVTIADDQVDVSSTWRPRIVSLEEPDEEALGEESSGEAQPERGSDPGLEDLPF